MSAPNPTNNSDPPILVGGLPLGMDMHLLERPPFYPRFWSPPEDPDKPELPYIPGFTVQIRRHVPPPSFFDSDQAREEPRAQLGEEYMKTVTQSKAVVESPPMETASPAQPDTAQLTVSGPIAIGDERGAQVVACSITPQRKLDGGFNRAETFHAAAKIYDPLYYCFKTDIGRHPVDCSYEADRDYSIEAAAYEALQKVGETGSSAPEYYGCWTFDLPISIDGCAHTRPVRLILMEQLQGSSILDSRLHNNPDWRMGKDSFHYPEEYRLEVLARAMDGFARQLSLGVNQADFAGRNIVLAIPSTPPTGEPDVVGGLCMPRVVLIDYNHARVDHQASPSLPCSPFEVFWRECISEDFGGWVPPEWDDEALVHEWLLRRFYINGRKELYTPLPDYLKEEAESLLRKGRDEPGEATLAAPRTTAAED